MINSNINLVELFAGVGGFSKGLINAGFNIGKHYFSEIDKHAIANYKYNFKNAESIGSVTDVRGRELQRPDIITFGSPCQDFSLAGKRKGMDGQRSSLILHAIRLIRELKPNFFIWENVKGAYSSNDGADFWGIIAAFTDIGGYRLEWQLLNTSWFLPQNRERIYLIGHLAEAGRDFKGIFPIREEVGVSNESRTNAEKQIASCVQGGGAGHTANGEYKGMNLIEYACVAQRGRNPENPSDGTTGAHTEQRLEPNSQGTTNTLTSVAKDNLIMTKPTIIQTNKSGQQFENDYAGTLRGEASANYMLVKSNTEKGFEEVKEGDSINFSTPSSKTRRGRVGKGKAQTLDTQSNQAVICPTLHGFEHGTNGHHKKALAKKGFIRRLTEIECERLQGFPDNWTEFGNYDGKIKSIPKTQRYKLLGNAVTTNVVKEIGLRLLSI